MIAWSASSPQVVSTTKSCASLAVANAWVAPNTVVAMSRLNSTGSTTTTFLAPARAAPCTALHADAAGAVDHHGLPGAHAARPDRRAPAGRHAAGHQRRDVEPDLFRDLDHRVLVHHRVLGERAEHAQAAEVLAALVEPERPVGEHPGGGVLARVAQLLTAGRAVPALAAGGNERAGHVVADLDPGDGLADRLDDAGALVPADDRQAHRRVALLDVVVGVAQARREELDPDLAVLRVVQLKLGDLPRLAGHAADRGSRGDAHVGPFPRWLRAARSAAATGGPPAAGPMIGQPPPPRQRPVFQIAAGNLGSRHKRARPSAGHRRGRRGQALVSGSSGPAMTSGRLMRNFTPRGSGIASTVPSCAPAIRRTIARPRPEPGSARACADR